VAVSIFFYETKMSHKKGCLAQAIEINTYTYYDTMSIMRHTTYTKTWKFLYDNQSKYSTRIMSLMRQNTYTMTWQLPFTKLGSSSIHFSQSAIANANSPLDNYANINSKRLLRSHKYIYIYIHIYTNIYIYIHIYIYIYTLT